MSFLPMLVMYHLNRLETTIFSPSGAPQFGIRTYSSTWLLCDLDSDLVASPMVIHLGDSQTPDGKAYTTHDFLSCGA
jgi:hypothetical protein